MIRIINQTFQMIIRIKMIKKVVLKKPKDFLNN